MTTGNRPTETECQTAIVTAAMLTGWKVHVQRPAMNTNGQWRTPISGHPGFPDMILARHNQLWAIELKRHPNRIEPAQQAWIDAINSAGLSDRPRLVNIAAFIVWVPEEQDLFIRELVAAVPDITQFIYRDTP